MQPFTITYTVKDDDLDELNHVNNVRYLDWVQEISKAHWAHATNNQYSDTFVWVVRKHEIKYFKAAKLHDVVRASTHIASNKGPISIRIVQFTDNKTNEVLVTSSTAWCLLDKKSLKPKRIPVAISELFQ